MRFFDLQPTAHKNADQAPDAEKVPFIVAKRIREAILDGTEARSPFVNLLLARGPFSE
jgi:hypothetical protein